MSARNIQADHTDGLGSVRAITDGSGNLIQTYQTDPFGVPTQAQGSSTQPFQFTGQQRDGNGLIYLRARYYDPSSGRFMSRDVSAGATQSPQSLNRYVYVTNNPVLWPDPSGLCDDPSALAWSCKEWAGGGEGGEGFVGEGGPGEAYAGGLDTAARTVIQDEPGRTGLVQEYGALGNETRDEARPNATNQVSRDSYVVRVTPEGLDIIERHLQRFGPSPENEAMIARLRAAMAEGRPVSGADANFYLHEISEATMMDRGAPYEQAHAAALQKYNASPYSVYHPDVIKTLSEWFNDNWRKFWGIH